MRKVGICTDCVCDLPEEYLAQNHVDTIYFYITTINGKFRDGYEVTSGNILEYLEEGEEKTATSPPDPQEYKIFFENALRRYDEVVHIAASSKVGESFDNANAALRLMGAASSRVAVVDSGQLSTGIGLMVMKAVELRDKGASAREIAEMAEQLRGKISSTFITRNADYLYWNGRTTRFVKKACEAFALHPVLVLRDGRIILKAVRAGKYERALIRYARGELRHGDRIDRGHLFITHAGCPVRTVSQIKTEIEGCCPFDAITVTKTSATVASNCGPETLGIMYINR